MAPAVTIGLPFHNEARWLAPAVRSMLRQSFTDFELLLVDDGSTDDSAAIARSFDDPRITVVSDGRRRHLPARLNEIARRARGRYLARMDGDDLSHPDRLRHEMALFERDPRLDAVGTWAALVDEDDEPISIVGSPEKTPTRASALERGILVHASLVSHRDWILQNSYDETLTRAEDRDLWIRTAIRSHFGVVESPLLTVRVHATADGFVAGYAEGLRQNRILVARYGPAAVGIARSARLWLESHAKARVMGLAVHAGLGRRLVRRRGRVPTAAERLLVAETFAAAR